MSKNLNCQTPSDGPQDMEALRQKRIALVMAAASKMNFEDHKTLAAMNRARYPNGIPTTNLGKW